MARLSNISVVVPSPSPHTTPSQSFDHDDFFGRTIDDILSEEATREIGRDKDEGISASNSSSLLGNSDLHDSLALPLSRARSIETESLRFPTPPPISVAPTSPSHEIKDLKLKASPKIRKILATMDLDKDINKVSKKESKKKSKKEHKKSKKDSSRLSEKDQNRDLDVTNPDKATHENEQGLDQPVVQETEESPEDKIFASVSAESQMAVLQFIASHTFMTTEAQPVLRSARRQFVDSVRNVAFAATMDNGSVDALMELVRKTYLAERSIVTADDDGSSFGNEIDDEAKEPLDNFHVKESTLCHEHMLIAKELAKISWGRDDIGILPSKKHKKRHSDTAGRHVHGTSAILDVSSGKDNVEVVASKKRKRCHSESSAYPGHAHGQVVTENVRHLRSATNTPTKAIKYLVEICSDDTLLEKKRSRSTRGAILPTQDNMNVGLNWPGAVRVKCATDLPMTMHEVQQPLLFPRILLLNLPSRRNIWIERGPKKKATGKRTFGENSVGVKTAVGGNINRISALNAQSRK
ncbi:uncharacterized protein N7511_006388 [Penicillium nucicola]|uniref:uncharacterized protein n=1 Tax=Penicillium nucicola TaxID=1850975 RepID=UPI002544EC17|nr:uncharacterized protein N7511_006388 [Penicillium nucicola]KAJ5757694.1 hypothetical protein N7511_006388 [Penicillium nucicola]